MARRSLDEIFAAPVAPVPPSQPSLAADVGKSLLGGIERGVAAVPMALPNLLNGLVAGPQLLGVGIKDTVTGNPTTKNPDIWQPFYSSEDVLQGKTAVPVPEALKPHTAETPAGMAADMGGQMLGGAIGTKAVQAGAPKAAEILASNTSGAPAKPPRATADDLRARAGQSYQAAEQAGGTLQPQVTDRFIASVQAMQPQSPQARQLTGDTAFTKAADVISQWKGQPLTLKAAQEIDEALSDAIAGQLDPKTGRLLADGKKLHDIQSSFRDAIEQAAPADVTGGKAGFDALKQARSEWSQSARLRDIETIVTRATLTDNPATAIKTGFKNLYTNAARMRGFTKDEAALIKNASQSGVLTDILRAYGSRLNPIITTASGAGGLGGSVASQAGSLAARSAVTKLQVGRAEKAAEAVANRAPVPPAAPHVQPPPNANSTPTLAAAAGGMASEIASPEAAQSQPAVAQERPQRRSLDDIFATQPAPPQASAPQSLVAAEGQKPRSYLDTEGHRTIGIGFNMDDPTAKKRWEAAGISKPFAAAYAGKASLTPDEMTRLATADLLTAETDARRLVGNYDAQPPEKQEALREMAFQLGGPRLSQFRPTLDLIEQGHYDQAAQRLLKTKYAQQTPERAQRLAALLAG